MIMSITPPWNPTCIERVLRVDKSSMRTARVQTDAGEAFVKPLGGCGAGHHPLACEYIGSSLACWLGLKVPDFCLMKLDDLDACMIQDIENGKAEAGYGFSSKLLPDAIPWDGAAESLEGIDNIDDICGMVLFDTWTLNWDRKPPDKDTAHNRLNLNNVLLARDEEGKTCVWAIDQGECISVTRELDPKRLASIDRVKNEDIYGCFAGFKKHIEKDAVDRYLTRLSELDRDFLRGILSNLPDDWSVDSKAKDAASNFLMQRARYLTDNFSGLLAKANGKLFL